MGYDDAACAITTTYFGRANASVPFWMDNVQCTGSEEVLDDCSFSGWGIHSCDHAYNDAGIVCANSKLITSYGHKFSNSTLYMLPCAFRMHPIHTPNNTAHNALL